LRPSCWLVATNVRAIKNWADSHYRLPPGRSFRTGAEKPWFCIGSGGRNQFQASQRVQPERSSDAGSGSALQQGQFLFPKETLIYYEAEQFGLYTASDDSQTRTLLVNAILYNDRFGSPEDTLLYELVTVTAQFDEEVASFQMLGSDRGNPEVHTEHPEGFDTFQMLGDTSLLGRPFTQVLQNTPEAADGSLVFYNAEKGVIGIKTLNRFWVLDREM
jgi:hypothetical protein